ncbi:MAG: SDR family NAD(P)-dependent oxidoreductase [Chloroflexi bacterium]|nr:SDR family NAD(P)-dependent oxidoreductase [Chloroflexota bacterium]
MGLLDGKSVLVTGASRGIGQTIAEHLGAEGGRIVCAARTLSEGDHMLEGSLERTVGNIREAGGEATALTANLADPDECIGLAERAAEVYGPIDVLVNNAVLTYFTQVVDYEPHRWQRAFQVNVHAPFLLSRAVLPSMIERGAGAIVNISSASAIGPGRGPYSGPPPKGRVEYGATKAALERFTQGLAQEVTRFGVAVSAVSPSLPVATPGTVLHNVISEGHPDSEPGSLMAEAVVLLATEPVEKVAGRVCYSQQLLAEYGRIESPRGHMADEPGSGYAQI